jgi:spermidine synthase
MVFALFFLSGALGLVYEVLWMRRFALLFGGTVVAATATLSGFFLGVAVGSALFGARARAWRRPLLAFGLLEGGVGLGALLALPLFEALRSLQPLAFSFHVQSPGLVLAQTLLAMAVVGLPAVCMGGTLPALAEEAARPGRGLGVPVGRLYAVNLAGAVAGTLAIPFVALPALGVTGSYAAAVAGSVLVAAVACGLGARAPAREPASPSAEAARPARRVAGGLLGLAALSGFGSLGAQALFTRMFSMVHESSLQAFAIVLVVFLVGLSGGAALACAALRRGLPPRLGLGLAWVAGGALVMTSPRLFHSATDGLAYLSAASDAQLVAKLLGLGALTVLPATLALGAALPLLFELGGGEGRDAGAVTGRLVMANTLGAILGPLAVTFAIAPALGPWTALLALGGLLAAAGASQLPGRARVAGLVAAALVAAATAPHGLAPVALRAERGERLVSLREGSSGTTAVLEDARDRWITVNNTYVLGGSASAVEERWQVHLPLLLHPAPRRVAALGLGTGISAGAALDHPFENLLALEIVPEVVEAARQDFTRWNHGLLEDPRVRVWVGDGRLALAYGGPFDVVVGDLLVPWRPGEAPLYTREHFAAVRGALAPDGLFCQWLPVYQLSEAQLAIAVRTFVDVFPRTTLWRGNFLPDLATLALVGHDDQGPLPVARVDARVEALRPRLREAEPLLQHPAGLWLHLVTPLGPAASWLADAPIDTDDHPRLELLGPRDLDRPGRFARGPLIGLYGDPRRRRLEATPLVGLDETHRGWWGVGLALTRATALPPDTAPERVLEALRELPPALRSALGVGEDR